MELDQETVYGTHDDSHIVMSEKVQSLAGSIYQEFEKMITKYDEDVVKDLMPLVVNVLESLDLAFTENQEHEVELELLREDNEQLVTQYEREKQLRKAADQKLFQIEDALEDDKKELNSKIESLESIVRMLELKSKNASDHVYRLEEKEQELKKEYSILHERYTELLKTHMEYIERTKLMMGSGSSDRMDSRPPRLPSMGLGHINSTIILVLNGELNGIYYTELQIAETTTSCAQGLELLKTHMEYIERTKLMMGSGSSDRMDSRPPRLPSMGLGHINSFWRVRCSEKVATRRANERREQYRQVRAHVRKDDGRLQAYGWSLPAKLTSTPPVHPLPPPSSSAQVPVPVPVYCRPLTEKEPGMKIWCAAGVNLSGGRTSDGGAIVGASVFYSDPQSGRPLENGEGTAPLEEEDKTDPADLSTRSPEIQKIDDELKEGERLRKELEEQEQQLSSLVWICTSTQQISKVAVIDANNPADILESFTVCQSHLLCIASVPGAKESDYLVNSTEVHSNGANGSADNNGGPESSLSSLEPAVPSGQENGGERNADNGESEHEDETANIGHVTFGTASEVPPSQTNNEEANSTSTNKARLPFSTRFLMGPRIVGKLAAVVGSGSALVTDINDLTSTTDSPPPRRLMREIQEGLVKDGLARPNELSGEWTFYIKSFDAHPRRESQVRQMTWAGDGVWVSIRLDSTLRMYNAHTYQHLQDVDIEPYVSKMLDILDITHLSKLKCSLFSHVQGRVVCALADGSVAIFRRGPDGQWDLSKYHTVTLGLPHHSVRSLAAVYNKVWCGYKNKIHVVDPKSLVVLKSFDAHPRRESQVRQMTWAGDGVWVSIRLDSTLRMYNAHTYQHLQDVDIEPYVSKMLGTGKLGFSFVRITALLISSSRLWIGTGNGVIISVPLSESNAGPASGKAPSGVRVFSEPATSVITPGTFIPYCSMAQAQLSFHGHRDAVKFFVSVPGSGGLSAATSVPQDCPVIENVSGTEKPPSMLVMSGGEGYIDFRIGDPEEDEEEDTGVATISKGEQSHLIVWQVANL
ncbi:C-Jun-amino-terminal kinase-interacting protein 3-like [Diaphorina citri]|uniref:C-Jun-amino-terminal kinase-interacting protein 3-like n=1 Tax=Diaphorina citri TaxID=121845 RepID=A0A3Q0IHV4_DIACI|nr:C-Jun-amino-terminal kinase-interacting protein 3-like [Diaphorina citri]